MRGEATMIELTLEQARVLAQAGERPATVTDPTTGKTYVLAPADASQQREEPRETPAPPWKHLVVRKHPWRKQLFLKGLNMTVRQLVGGIKANGFTDEEAA